MKLKKRVLYSLWLLLLAGFAGLHWQPLPLVAQEMPDSGVVTEIDREIPDDFFKSAFQDSLRAAWHADSSSNLRCMDSLPGFAYGERISYDVSWEFVSAGQAQITLSFDSSSNTLRCVAKGISNSFISTFFKLRDGLISTMDAAGFYPLFFGQRIREGKYRAERWYLFDQYRQIVYSNEKVKQARCAPFTQDFLSVLYYVRSRPLSVGDTFTIPLHAHPETHSVFFKVTQRKKIQGPNNSYMCLCLVPKLSGKGRVFSKKDEIKLWLTDDQFHIPVLATTKLKFGALVLTLNDYQSVRQ